MNGFCAFVNSGTVLRHVVPWWLKSNWKAAYFNLDPQWLTFNLFWNHWFSRLKKTKPKKVNLFFGKETEGLSQVNLGSCCFCWWIVSHSLFTRCVGTLSGVFKPRFHP